MKYAGFWLRFAAFLVDGFIIVTASVFIFIIDLSTNALLKLVLPSWTGSNVDFSYQQAIDMESFVTIAFASLLYGALFESSIWQATPGKKLLGIKVVDYDGNRLEFPQALGRVFFEYFSTATFGLGYLMIAFTERKQGLHDMIAKCLVVKDE